ncbi:MAG: response regulator transcription factor [Bdellovibrionota bacterium]
MDAVQYANKIRIVVIDDHQVVREGLVAMINAQIDMEVVGSCDNPVRGYELIDETSPSIVITDISMPEGAPFEMVKEAKQKLPNLKVIFLTGYGTDSNLERALRSGGEGFICKNEPMQDFIEAIREIEAGHTYFSREISDRIVKGNEGEEQNGIYSEELVVRKELLSSREVEVLCCVAKGLTAKQIAGALKISAKTVERHKSNIMAKLRIHSQVDLARYAIREGYIVA